MYFEEKDAFYDQLQQVVVSILKTQTQNVFIPSARLILIVFVLHSSYRFLHLLKRFHDCIRSERTLYKSFLHLAYITWA